MNHASYRLDTVFKPYGYKEKEKETQTETKTREKEKKRKARLKTKDGRPVFATDVFLQSFGGLS